MSHVDSAPERKWSRTTEGGRLRTAPPQAKELVTLDMVPSDSDSDEDGDFEPLGDEEDDDDEEEEDLVDDSTDDTAEDPTSDDRPRKKCKVEGKA